MRNYTPHLTLLKIKSRKYVIRELSRLIRKGKKISAAHKQKTAPVFADEINNWTKEIISSWASEILILADEIDNWASEIETFYRLYTDNDADKELTSAVVSSPPPWFPFRREFESQDQIIERLNSFHETINQRIDKLSGIITKIERNEYAEVFIKRKQWNSILRTGLRTGKKAKPYIIFIGPLVIYGVIVYYGILKFDFNHIIGIIAISITTIIYSRSKKD